MWDEFAERISVELGKLTLALMKFAHRILIKKSVSYNLWVYQVLPVSASPVLSSICSLTYAIPRQVSGLICLVSRLNIFACFFRCTAAYRL